MHKRYLNQINNPNIYFEKTNWDNVAMGHVTPPKTTHFVRCHFLPWVFWIEQHHKLSYNKLQPTPNTTTTILYQFQPTIFLPINAIGVWSKLKDMKPRSKGSACLLCASLFFGTLYGCNHPSPQLSLGKKLRFSTIVLTTFQLHFEAENVTSNYKMFFSTQNVVFNCLPK